MLKATKQRRETQTEVLRREIGKVIDGLPLMLRATGLATALTHLQAWVGQVDQRLQMLEGRAITPRERALLAIIETARSEGQLSGAIEDETRPGGAREGDKVV